MFSCYRFIAGLLLLCGLLLVAPNAARAQGCGQQNPNCIVPTAPPGTSNNQAASTAFVQGAVGGSVVPVPKGGTGQTSFTPNLPLIGNGTSAIQQGTVSGNTTQFGTVSGSFTPGDCVKADANGNLTDQGQPCGSGSGGNTPFVQDFLSGTNFTPGTTTSLTLSSAPSTSTILAITFDGITQSANTWSLSGAVVTFDAAIPTNTQVVEARWSVASTLAGVSSIVAGSDTITGSAVLSPGNGTTITGSGQTATIGNSLQIVSIQDAAFGAKCDGVSIQSGGTLSLVAGTTTLVYSAGSFAAADVGKVIDIPGAGTSGAYLFTTIATFVAPAEVTLTAPASTTISQAPTIAAPFVYGTDDTAAIQAAMGATPDGGILDIPAAVPNAAVSQQVIGGVGCLIRQQGSNSYALLQDHPFSIRGHGHFSNLMTDLSIPSTVDDVLVNAGAFDWANTVWENFSIGDYPSFLPSALLMYTRHGARGLALVDNAGAGFLGISVRNMSIGESGNNYSLYLGNPTSSGSQFNLFTFNKIWGGIKLDHVEDSHRITHNVLQGKSTFGGEFGFVQGSGKFEFSGNNVTWAGGTVIENSTKPAIINNYFEELFATSEPNNSMVDFNGGFGTIAMPTFTGNIVNADISTTSIPVRYGNVSNGNFGDNFIGTSTSRLGVISVTTLSCIAPNVWNGPSTRFSTSLANSYPGC